MGPKRSEGSGGWLNHSKSGTPLKADYKQEHKMSPNQYHFSHKSL